MVIMKIFRLSLFNIKKSNKEAAAIAFLAMISALFLGIIVANAGRINSAFHDSFRKSGSFNTVVSFPGDKYRDDCIKVLTDDYGIESPEKINMLFPMGASIKDKNDDTYSINLLLITPSSEKKIEDFVMADSLSDETLAKVEHPIWLPLYFKLNRGFEMTDSFVMVMNGRDYPFTIAGFYETGMMANDGMIVKCVISEEDYSLLEPVSTKYVSLYFNSDNFPSDEYAEKCDEYTSENLSSDMLFCSEELEKMGESQFLDLFLTFLAFFSVITLVSAMFMVRHKISNDIEDQMQQIGVLEALGYKSKEISASYVCEYLLSGGVGAILGGITTLVLTPVFNWVISVMMGRTCTGKLGIAAIIVTTVLVIAIIVIFALLKARSVKKYPPVVAFRKGIETHHFGKNHLPLNKAKGNINIRIAIKDFFSELKSLIGVAICITLASLAILFCVSFAYFFRNGYHSLISFFGTEVSEVTVKSEDGVDIKQLGEEISQMPEVRKTLLTYGDFTQFVKVKDSDMVGTIVTFEDYSQTENIKLSEGRFPQYDNEVMISVGRRERENYHVGDSIVLQGDSAAQKYIITGVVGGMLNGGNAIYMNYGGLKRINPYAALDTIDIYLNEGVDRDDFEKKLVLMYGSGTEQMAENVSLTENASLDERIKTAADEKMAVLKSQYGVTSIEYAIVIDDKVITGNSSKFMIKKISSTLDLAKGQMESIANITKIFSVVSSLVITGIVAVILGIISVSNVRRRKKDIGIMKSLGYSSKDLMTQMAWRIMPPAIVGAGIALILCCYVYKLFWLAAFAVEVKPELLVLVPVDIALILFCYFVTYISAGKIKQISVTELMTE